jgi:hypothetical protein
VERVPAVAVGAERRAVLVERNRRALDLQDVADQAGAATHRDGIAEVDCRLRVAGVCAIFPMGVLNGTFVFAFGPGAAPTAAGALSFWWWRSSRVSVPITVPGRSPRFGAALRNA